MRKKTQKEQFGIFSIEYECVKCHKDTEKVYLTADDRANHPATLSSLCYPCLLETPQEDWVTEEKVKAGKAVSLAPKGLKAHDEMSGNLMPDKEKDLTPKARSKKA